MTNLWNAFAARVRADPSAPALISDESTISFGELHGLALRYAAALAVRGVRHGDVVALQLPKRTAAYALLLACLRLGAPYVFIDPRNPAARSARILERIRPAILFAIAETANPYGSVISLADPDRDWVDPNGSSLSETDLHTTGSDPAYIMFTSGSTGEPKGAVIPHQGVLNLMEWARSAVCPGPGERFTNVNPLHFDNSVFDLYCGLLNGAALVPVETGGSANPAVWVKAVRLAQATVMFAVPTLFLMLDQLGLLTPAALPGVRTFIFGGEGYPIQKLRDFHARFSACARLVNVYGPTETSCICSSIEISEEHLRGRGDEFPPLGRMHDGFSYLLLDQEQRAVAPGSVGELWIGGPGVGLGYYGNPEATVARFRQDPRQNRSPSIFYRSGDLVREDGERRLWFHGRVDNQVKLRGYRIELEEVDLVVQGIPGVQRAAAVVLPGIDGGELAVAFTADRTIETDEVLAACKQKLPQYMHPARVFQLGDLPRNANGKLDRLTTRGLLEKLC
jgi:D-alanine--poly(phosphoribitol) ligase subunit 1